MYRKGVVHRYRLSITGYANTYIIYLCMTITLCIIGCYTIHIVHVWLCDTNYVYVKYKAQITFMYLPVDEWIEVTVTKRVWVVFCPGQCIPVMCRKGVTICTYVTYKHVHNPLRGCMRLYITYYGYVLYASGNHPTSYAAAEYGKIYSAR